jgi:glutamate-ammonia-ligase adenylyltransferase
MAEETLNQEVVHPIYPDHSSSPPLSPFCVLGLGKLGGRELGYASDLDLIFVYSLKTPFLSESGKPPSPGRGRDGKKWITYHEYLVKLAQRLISYLSLPLKEGAGYAIDTRLRPSGSFGPLIVSLDAFREYYRGQARNWEKQALLKARIIVGSPKLSRQVQETVARILYETPPPSQVREEMAQIRSRMEKERSGEGSGRFNPKLGFGGLTDIEFLVQFLQWTHGPAFPDLRKTNTLQALKSLSNNGLLSDETHLQLQEAYQFLTTLDHGLQLLFDRKGDARTYDPEELKQLVDLNVMGLGNPTLLSWDMVSHYEKVRCNVRSIFKTVFSGQVQAG